MIDYDFEKSISFWVGTTSHAIEQAMSAELAGTGVTFRQVQVLACLALCGDLAQTELAEHMRIEPSTLVRLLDRMQRDGWIERHDDPKDRRKKLVRPTKKVEPHWDQIVTRGERMEKQALKGLTKAQLNELKQTLAKIRSNLGVEV
jgi:MarR family transcriptional regulator for hemolysin